MNKKRPLYLPFILGMLTIQGCSPFSEEWTRSNYSGNRFSNFVILGVSPNAKEQLFFENQASNLLDSKNLASLKGTSVFSKELFDYDEHKRDAYISSIILKNEIDAILTIETVFQANDEYLLPEGYSRFSKFYSRKSFNTYTPAYYKLGYRFLMVATLFDLKNNPKEQQETASWKAYKVILDPDKNERKKADFIQNVLNHLIDEKLITLRTKENASS